MPGSADSEDSMAPSVISFSSSTADAGMSPNLRVRTVREAEANCTNSSLLMKLKSASARVDGASSTFRNLTAWRAPIASISRCVSSPSPDHPEASTSIRRWYFVRPGPGSGLLSGVVNGHQAAQYGQVFARREAVALDDRIHFDRARVT